MKILTTLTLALVQLGYFYLLLRLLPARAGWTVFIPGTALVVIGALGFIKVETQVLGYASIADSADSALSLVLFAAQSVLSVAMAVMGRRSRRPR